MKVASRILTLVVVSVLLVGVVVVPARADEIDNALGVVDVLQYSTANDSGRNTFTFTGSYNVRYTFPESMYVTYVDMLVSTDSVTSRPAEVLGGRGTLGSLTILQVTSGLYRVYGEVPRRMTNYIDFTFTSTRSSGESYYQILSLQVSEIEKRHFEDKVQATTIAGSSVKTGTWSPGADMVDVGFTASDANSTYVASFSALNWERYDYFDFYLMLSVFEINSITAHCGSIAVPISVQYLDSGASYGDYYYVIVRMDLRGLDKTGVDPVLSITGGSRSGYNDVLILSGSGFIIYDSTDPYIYAMRVQTADLVGALNNLGVFVDMGFSGLYQVNQNGFQSVVDALTPEANTAIGDDLVSQGQQMQQYEQQHQMVLQSGVNTLQQAGNIAGFATSLAFIGNYTTSVFNRLGDVQVLYTLPLSIALILFLASRAPGAMRPHKHNTKRDVNSAATKPEGKKDE